MRHAGLALLLSLLLPLSTSSAAGTLQPRDLDGNPNTIEAYYDTAQNITWLQNANAGAGSAYDDGMYSSDGRMTWKNAMAWAASLKFTAPGAGSGWRLPTMVTDGGACKFSLSGGTHCGQNVITTPGTPNSSEIGYLYVALGNKPAFSTTPGVLNPKPWMSNTSPFSGIDLQYNAVNYATPDCTKAGGDSRDCRDDAYWYNVSDASNGGASAWKFLFGEGEQIGDAKNVEFFAWAVHDGDVGNKTSQSAVNTTTISTATSVTKPTVITTTTQTKTAAKAPTITGITHSSTASLLYTITGTGFAKGATLLIGGLKPVSTWQGGTTFIVFQPPLNKTGTVDVQVTNPDGGKVVKKGGFTYPSSAIVPIIRGVAPNQNSTTLKTVWGSNFENGAKVYVNGTLAPSQWQVGTQYIVFQPPAGTPSGVATVKVVNPGGGSVSMSGNLTIAVVVYPTPYTTPVAYTTPDTGNGGVSNSSTNSGSSPANYTDSGIPTFTGKFISSFRDPGTNGWGEALEFSPFPSQRGTVLLGTDSTAAGYSTNFGQRWWPAQGYGPVGMNMLDSFTWHPTNPNIVWASTLRGPALSTDGGKSYVQKRNGMPAMGTDYLPSRDTGGGNYTAVTTKVLYDPNDSANQTLLAFGGNHRGGANSKDNNDTPDPTHSNGVVWRSTDGGDTWSHFGDIPGNIPVFSAAWSGKSTHVYASTIYGVYRSVDSGHTWTSVANGMAGAQYTTIDTHPTTVDTLWAIDWKANMYWTTDGGDTWHHAGGDNCATCAGYMAYSSTIKASKLNPNIVYAASVGGVYLSTDGGRNFTNVLGGGGWENRVAGGLAYTANLSPQALAVDPQDPNGNTAMVYTGDAIVLTKDRGATWTNASSQRVNSGTPAKYRGNGYNANDATMSKWSNVANQFFALGGDLSKIVRSSDYGWSWDAKVPYPLAVYGSSDDVSTSLDGQTIYIATGYSYGRSDIYPDDRDPSNSGACANPSNCRHGLIRSTDGGATWDYAPIPVGVNGETQGVYCDPTDPRKVWATVGPNLIRSVDGGNNWSVLRDDLDRPKNIVAEPNNSQIMYVSGGLDAGVLKSTDGGASFSNIPGSPHDRGMTVTVDTASPANLYVATKHLFKYTGATGVWSENTSLQYVASVDVDPGNRQRLAVTTAEFGGQDVTLASGLWLSSDGGTTWENIRNGLPSLTAASIVFNPDKSAQLAISAQGGGTFVMDAGNSTPFSGSPITVPGTVQAENYDNGGADAAYHTASGAPSRSSVTGLVAHDWIKYRVSAAAGIYDITLHGKGGTVHLEANGVNISGPTSLPAGSSGDVVIRGAELSGGTQYLKLYVESGSASVDSMRFDLR